MIDEQTTESILEDGQYQTISPNKNIKPFENSTISSFSPFTSRRRIFVDKGSPKIIRLHINITREQKRQHFSRINSAFRKSSNYLKGS